MKDGRNTALEFAEMLSSLIEHAVIGSPSDTENLKAFMKKIQGLTIGQVFEDCKKASPQTKEGAKLREDLLKFSETYASNKIATLLSGTFRQSLYEAKSRFYLHAPPARVVSKKSLKTSDSDSEIKAPKKYKGKYFSKPDRKFKSRSWCITNVDSKSVASFLKSCAKVDGLSNYWSLWLDDVASNVSPKLVNKTELVFPVALFDVRDECVQTSPSYRSRSEQCKVRDSETINVDVGAVGKSMESLFHSLCTLCSSVVFERGVRAWYASAKREISIVSFSCFDNVTQITEMTLIPQKIT